ncbi:hypothetical protein [Roseovarius ramblicola]|uniref:Porin n=1 Tax=Roseovarius ramblicola TaxID=2022336 RepID=A0ABV5I4V4_9RHOB
MKSPLATPVVLAALLFGTSALAGDAQMPPLLPQGNSEEDETAAYIGLNWTFGRVSTLEGVLGVLYRETDRGGDVTGARLSGHFDLLGRGAPPSLRLTGILGDEDIAAEAGLGIGLDGSPLGVKPYGVLGAIGNYYNFGGIIGFDGSFGGYAGAHSYGDFDDGPPDRRGMVYEMTPP